MFTAIIFKLIVSSGRECWEYCRHCD